MQKHLVNSTASYPGGISSGRRVFKVQSGPYSGRLVILMQSSSSEIKLTCSDYPYSSWSSPSVIINDTGDYTFDALMTDNGDIYVVYTLGSNNDLVHRQLTFSGGIWSAGNLVTLYNGDDNYYPVINLEPPNRLWVGYSRYSSSQYYINVKYSDDWGINWSGGSGSPGSALTGGASSAFVRIVVMGDYVYAIYTYNGTKLSYRRKQFLASVWNTESDIATGSGFDEDFDAFVSENGRIGVAFDDGSMKFRQYNGDTWDGITIIDSDGGSFPQVKYSDNVPYVIYLSSAGSGQNNIVYSRWDGSGFSTPRALDETKTTLAKVFCYDASVGSFEDLTSQAGDDSSSDIYHTDSSAVFKDIGDALYLGLDARYHYLKITLSTIGVGGNVNWQYYNGLEWVGFVPSGGSYHFTNLDIGLLLWDDVFSIQPNWQKTSVNSSEKFWIKVTVTTPYTTGPVGTRITTMPDAKAVVLMER